MLDKSLFVSTEVVTREVEFANGIKQTLFFKELTDSELTKHMVGLGASDEVVKANSKVEFIAASVCDKDGLPLMTVEQAKNLKSIVINQLVMECIDVNGYGDKKKD